MGAEKLEYDKIVGVGRPSIPMVLCFSPNNLTFKSWRKQPQHYLVTTTIISGTDHMYAGEEKQVANVITKWIDGISTQGKK